MSHSIVWCSIVSYGMIWWYFVIEFSDGLGPLPSINDNSNRAAFNLPKLMTLLTIAVVTIV